MILSVTQPVLRPFHAFGSALALACCLLGAGCGSDERPGGIMGDSGSGGRPDGGPVDRCLLPNTGCDCPKEGEETDCGKVTERHGDYVTCSMGTRTCVDGEWSACIGERITLKSTNDNAGRLRPLDLGEPMECPDGFDDCDPYCNVTTDGPGTDIDAGPGFDPTGLTLVETGVGACTMLTLSPSASEVTVTDFSPLVASPSETVTFTLTATPMGCTSDPFDVTWAVDKLDRVVMSGTDNTDGEMEIAVPIAGPVRVTAYGAGLSASTDISIKVNVWEVPTNDPAASPNEAAYVTERDSFGTWDNPNPGTATSSVTWLYPYQDTYFPLGLPAPHALYRYSRTPDGSGAVRVSMRWPVNSSSDPAAGNYSDFNYSLVVDERNVISKTVGVPDNYYDPQVFLSQEAWEYFEQSARGEDADLVVQRYARISGTDLVETERAQRIHLVDGQLRGTVFYNSYSSPLAGDTGAVLSIEPGATQPTVAVQPRRTSDGARRCTVCHTVNLDGTRLIANGERPSGGVVRFNQSQRFDISDATTFPEPPVLNQYDNSQSDDWSPVPDQDIQGDRFTFGAPWTDGSLYMTHGGSLSFGGDRNWRAPPDYSRLYRPDDSPLTAITVAGWNNISAVTPKFSADGTKLGFGFWGASGQALPQSPSGTLAADTTGTSLAVVDFSCASPPCSGASTGWEVTNARNVTPAVGSGVNATTGTLKVGWPAFSPGGEAVFYQRQYRASNTSWSWWSPSPINTVAGAMAEIWMSDIPADSSSAASPTRLLALNGLDSGGTSYLPQDARTIAPAVTAYHRDNGGFWINRSDGCGDWAYINNVYDHRLNYLPSTAPEQAGGFTWVVFTSRRMYGNVAYDDPWDAEPNEPCNSGQPQTKKLWVAAVDGTFTPGTDPSHPAFYLPGQELEAGNSDGYWIAAACLPTGSTCATNDDCCGGTGGSPTTSCRVTSTATVPPIKECTDLSACSDVGGACTTTDDCCAGLFCPDGGGSCLFDPPPIFETQVYEREYEAECPADSHVAWRFFEWQATIPTDTSIEFAVQTKELASDSYSPMTPLPLSTATADTMMGTWDRGPDTVDDTLWAASPPQRSKTFLKVTMTFNPDPAGSVAPTLSAWRQVFDCLPAE